MIDRGQSTKNKNISRTLYRVQKIVYIVTNALSTNVFCKKDSYITELGHILVALCDKKGHRR